MASELGRDMLGVDYTLKNLLVEKDLSSTVGWIGAVLHSKLLQAQIKSVADRSPHPSRWTWQLMGPSEEEEADDGDEWASTCKDVERWYIPYTLQIQHVILMTMVLAILQLGEEFVGVAICVLQRPVLT